MSATRIHFDEYTPALVEIINPGTDRAFFTIQFGTTQIFLSFAQALTIYAALDDTFSAGASEDASTPYLRASANGSIPLATPAEPIRWDRFPKRGA